MLPPAPRNVQLPWRETTERRYLFQKNSAGSFDAMTALTTSTVQSHFDQNLLVAVSGQIVHDVNLKTTSTSLASVKNGDSNQ
jgi:hypothetical protein